MCSLWLSMGHFNGFRFVGILFIPCLCCVRVCDVCSVDLWDVWGVAACVGEIVLWDVSLVWIWLNE